MPLSNPCPRCGAEVPPRDLGCSHCGRSLLYGLIAAPVHDSARVDAAARVLVSWPGGPGLGDARQRVAEGLPLLVGLSRQDADDLQGKLVDLGLLPRIGPAPEGTQPLSAAARAFGLKSAVAVALVAAGAAAYWLVSGPGPTPPTPGGGETGSQADTMPRAPRAEPSPVPTPAATPTPETIPAAWLLHLDAHIARGGDGALMLVGSAQVRTSGRPPSEDLELTMRVGSAGTLVLNQSVPASTARTKSIIVDNVTVVIKSITFRLPLDEGLLGEVEGAILEGTWEAWRSRETPVVLHSRAGPSPNR